MDCLTPKPVFLNHQAALSPGRKYYRKGVLLNITTKFTRLKINFIVSKTYKQRPESFTK